MAKMSNVALGKSFCKSLIHLEVVGYCNKIANQVKTENLFYWRFLRILNWVLILLETWS